MRLYVALKFLLYLSLILNYLKIDFPVQLYQVQITLCDEYTKFNVHRLSYEQNKEH